MNCLAAVCVWAFFFIADDGVHNIKYRFDKSECEAIANDYAVNNSTVGVRPSDLISEQEAERHKLQVSLIRRGTGI